MKRNFGRTSAVVSVASGLVGAIWPHVSQAQQTAPLPLKTSAPAAAPNDDFGPCGAELPFEIQHNWIVLEVHVGKDVASAESGPKLHFLFDTGCGKTSISQETFDSNKLDLALALGDKPSIRITGTGDSSGAIVNKIVNARIEVGALDLETATQVLPMGIDFKTLGIDGLIGGDLMGSAVVEVDYEARRLRIYQPQDFKPPTAKSGFMALPIIFDSIEMPVVKIDLTAFGFTTVSASLELDTGSDAPLTLYSPFVARNKWQDVLEATAPLEQVGIGGRSAARSGRLKSLQIAGVTLHQPPVNFMMSAQGLLARDGTDGQLGGDVLKRFTLIFDYGHKLLYVRPNSSASTPFPMHYYVGFTLTKSSLVAAEYNVSALDEKSPAARAGLREGDILRKVDGKIITNMSPEELGAFLGNSMAERTFEVRRGTSSLTLTVKPVAY